MPMVCILASIMHNISCILCILRARTLVESYLSCSNMHTRAGRVEYES